MKAQEGGGLGRRLLLPIHPPSSQLPLPPPNFLSLHSPFQPLSSPIHFFLLHLRHFPTLLLLHSFPLAASATPFTTPPLRFLLTSISFPTHFLFLLLTRLAPAILLKPHHSSHPLYFHLPHLYLSSWSSLLSPFRPLSRIFVFLSSSLSFPLSLLSPSLLSFLPLLSSLSSFPNPLLSLVPPSSVLSPLFSLHSLSRFCSLFYSLLFSLSPLLSPLPPLSPLSPFALSFLPRLAPFSPDIFLVSLFSPLSPLSRFSSRCLLINIETLHRFLIHPTSSSFLLSPPSPPTPPAPFPPPSVPISLPSFSPPFLPLPPPSLSHSPILPVPPFLCPSLLLSLLSLLSVFPTLPLFLLSPFPLSVPPLLAKISLSLSSPASSPCPPRPSPSLSAFSTVRLSPASFRLQRPPCPTPPRPRGPATVSTLFLHPATVSTLFLHPSTVSTLFLHPSTVSTLFLHPTTVSTLFLHRSLTRPSLLHLPLCPS
ncbi:unnamed protein product [Closterium sp. NIES-54]